MVSISALGKRKQNFVIGSINVKVNKAFTRNNPKVSQKLFDTYYCLDGHSGIEDWNFIIFKDWKTQAPMKE